MELIPRRFKIGFYMVGIILEFRSFSEVLGNMEGNFDRFGKGLESVG
jgi:hypothetical protein